jgi:uncharacterized membrane protein YvbJ
MRCRNCGTEIADKALICYRCGTATTEAKFKPAAVSNRRSSSLTWIIAGVVVLLIVLAIVFLLSRPAAPSGRLDFNDRYDAVSARFDARRDRIDRHVAAA